MSRLSKSLRQTANLTSHVTTPQQVRPSLSQATSRVASTQSRTAQATDCNLSFKQHQSPATITDARGDQASLSHKRFLDKDEQLAYRLDQRQKFKAHDPTTDWDLYTEDPPTVGEDQYAELCRETQGLTEVEIDDLLAESTALYKVGAYGTDPWLVGAVLSDQLSNQTEAVRQLDEGPYDKLARMPAGVAWRLADTSKMQTSREQRAELDFTGYYPGTDLGPGDVD